MADSLCSSLLFVFHGGMSYVKTMLQLFAYRD